MSSSVDRDIEARPAELEVRQLIERWVAAVQAGDLDQVLAHHTDDVVMFDVPPPEEGARGLDAYAATWPPFFEWIRSGARFELVELTVVTGDDVGYACALLQCGKDEQLRARPDRRLRISFGVRRGQEAWEIAHEHHSFTDTD
jgi:uncharacterized protein (TIGR02246 family)